MKQRECAECFGYSLKGRQKKKGREHLGDVFLSANGNCYCCLLTVKLKEAIKAKN